MQIEKPAVDESLRKDIEAALVRRNIPHQRWGIETGTNQLEYFSQDMETGAIEWEYESNTNTFMMRVTTVRVMCERDSKTLLLKPSHQSFKKGAYGEPVLPDVTLTKVIRGRTAYAAITQGMIEDFGESQPGFKESDNYQLYAVPGIVIQDSGRSILYPPLEVILEIKHHRCLIKNGLYLEKYSSKKGNKDVEYIWVEVPAT
jgi:hypothetical protein